MQQNYLIELDGTAAGRFSEFSGGGYKPDVITRPSRDRGPIKHLASAISDDMLLTCGTGMSRAFYAWIEESTDGVALRKHGAVMVMDYQQKPKARIEFMNSLLTSVELPELVRSSTEAAQMRLKLSPEKTIISIPNGAAVGVYINPSPKLWNIGSFRLSIDDLDCSQVTKISKLSFGQKLVEERTGNSRESVRIPSKLEYSNIRIQIPEMFAQGFLKWYDDSVRNSDSVEKRGKLEYLTPTAGATYFEVEFNGLGIFETSVPAGAGIKASTPITFGLYFESMKFKAGPAALI